MIWLNAVSWNDVPLEEVSSHEYVEKFALQADNWRFNQKLTINIDGRILSAVGISPISRGEPLIVNNVEENKYYLRDVAM